VLINDGFGPGAGPVGAQLGERDPVVQVPMLAFGTAVVTVDIEELADRVVRELRPLSAGPFHLVGARGGGLLAFVVAQQLTEMGVSVAGLTLISSYPLPAVVDDEIMYETLFLIGVGADPEDLGYPGSTATGRLLQALTPAGEIPAGALVGLAGHPDPQLRAVAPIAARLAALNRQDRVEMMSARLGWPAEDAAAALVGGRALLNAAAAYRPTAYMGDVRLLVHSEESPVWPTMVGDMRAYWSQACVGRLVVESVPGNHFTCCDNLGGAQVDLPEGAR
jgi:pyochelin synthetase